MNQSKIDSAMETVTNTAVGFVLSLIVWQGVCVMYRIPMPITHNLGITTIFTIVSLVRQYVIRRAFNGRTVWQAIRAHLVTRGWQ